jgi:mono/diheme cytochrome c family protein
MATPPPPERRTLRDADEPDKPRRADAGPWRQDEDADKATTGRGDALASPRREAAENNEIPRRYRDMRNSVGHTVSAIAAGAELYQNHCAACHGPRGAGDGPRAQRTGARMPDLGHTVEQEYATDTYLIWTIMKGGEPVGTDKPGFEDTLSERQAWRLIAYLRAGLPEADARRTAGGLMPPDDGGEDDGEDR